MDIQDLKNLLRKHNLKPNFTYGQNFLVDDEVLENIMNAASVLAEDIVLEIGPGVGNLTRRLCERAGFVLSIEKDPKFLPILKAIKKDFPENFRFETADALEFDYLKYLEPQTSNLEFKYKVVANIPYFITGKILQMLLSAKLKPISITILTQKEVAQRVCAKAGELSVLAISVQIFGEPKIIRLVPRKSFYPSPEVDSAILKIDVRENKKYEIPDEKKFFKVLKACFAGKRKQLHNTLVNNLKLEKTRVVEILQALNIDPKARPQELSIDDWIKLSEKLF